MNSTQILDTGLPVPSLGEQRLANSTLFSPVYTLILVTIAALSYGLYQWALPKPIPGIPYNEAATKNLLGDVPDLMKGLNEHGEFQIWLHQQAAKFNAPLFQVFVRPFRKPMLILSDFREAQDVLMRRKDFDRATTIVGDVLEGVSPDHHIQMKSDGEWKRHRKLVQDLMSPIFLNTIAGPIIYTSIETIIQLWHEKTRMADGRPFRADLDVYHGALDATAVFIFGESFTSSALRPTAKLVSALGPKDVERLRGSTPAGDDKLMEFPEGEVDANLKSMLDMAAAIEEVQGSPIPKIKWMFLKRQAWLKSASKVKDAFIRDEINKAITRMDSVGNQQSQALSAVELMVLRERKLAESEGRPVDFYSPMMMDEILGAVVAGHDTTSTTICWGTKLLADNPGPQAKLREALRAAFPEAAAEDRNPTIQEITGTKVPVLDATIEEILRVGGAAVLLDRQATCDTELLGHRIPKDTIVLSLSRGQGICKPAVAVDESKRSKTSQSAKPRAWDDEDISEFKPERWLVKGEGDEVEFDLHAGPQLAFGYGTRGCFGRRLAYLELRIVITLIGWNFELHRCPEALSGYSASEGLTYKPKSCYVRLSALGKN